MKTFTRWTMFCALLCCLCLGLSAALVPPSFLDCVVAIGLNEPQSGGPPRWVATASGFLYGDLLRKIDGGQKVYNIYMVTNRHVFEGRDSMVVRFNPKAPGPAKEYTLVLKDKEGKQLWYAHPNRAVDVSIVPINVQKLSAEGIQFDYFRSDQDLLDRVAAKEVGISEGDGIFVLGFPMGLAGGERNYVIIRDGSIARIRDVLESPSTLTFLIDAFVFPGSSGGPVVSKPEMFAIQGTKSINQAFLIGLVKGFVPYTDIAVSAHTKRPRITFEENSGLAEVIPADYIRETVQAYANRTPGER